MDHVYPPYERITRRETSWRLLREAALILFIGGFLYWAFSPLFKDKPKEAPHSLIKPLDINTVVDASIDSIRAQNKLLVMTANVTAAATSTTESMKMKARATYIASTEVQFFLDLTKVNKSHFKATDKGLTLTLPESLVSVKFPPRWKSETYDNDSWLFTVNGEAREELAKANWRKVAKSFAYQARSQKPQAVTNAKAALTSLLETPLQAVGYQKKVEVVFTKA